METLVEKIKDIILENNYFNTLPGERFMEWNGIRNIAAVIAFAGRSKKQKSYRLTTESDSESMYVTHLYIDPLGEVKAQISSEDNDDFELIIHPSGIPVETFDDEILKEWVNLLTW
jgi:hypothetical protein